MSFIRLHAKNKPMLMNVDNIAIVYEKLKGVGSIIEDGSGEKLEVDETVDDISAMLGDLDVEIIESAND